VLPVVLIGQVSIVIIAVVMIVVVNRLLSMCVKCPVVCCVRTLSRDEIVQMLSSAIDFLSDNSLPSDLSAISTKLSDYRCRFDSITGYVDFLCVFALPGVAVTDLAE